MAEMKIHPDMLLKDELIYEIQLITDEDVSSLNLDELRKKYRELVKANSKREKEWVLDPVEEVKVCEAKILEIEEVVRRALKQNLGPRLWHIVLRLERVQSVRTGEIRKKVILMGQAMKLLNEVMAGGISEATASGGSIDLGNIVNVERESNLGVRQVLLSKWNVTFNGRSSLQAFLIRIEELAEAHRVTKEELFHSIVQVLQGEALLFYRNVKSSISSWTELVSLFKSEFQPIDWERRLLWEIQGRLQGKEERVGTYLNIMQHMFDRMEENLLEDRRLEIVMTNLSPFYIEKLAMYDVTSFAQLQELCKKIEIARFRCENRGYSNKGTESMVPDLAVLSTPRNLDREKRVNTMAQGSCGKADQSRLIAKIRCPKCEGEHPPAMCKKYVGIHCFNCKRQGVLSTVCSCKRENLKEKNGSSSKNE